MPKRILKIPGLKNKSRAKPLVDAKASLRELENPSPINHQIIDAIVMGHDQFVIDMLNDGIDPDVRDNRGGEHNETALMVALRFERRNLAKLLLEKGADVDARDRYGFPAVMEASLSELPLLVEYAVDLNASDVNGDTALIRAVERGEIEMIRGLLEHGADKNHTAGGKTALDVARNRCCFPYLVPEIIELLKD